MKVFRSLQPINHIEIFDDIKERNPQLSSLSSQEEIQYLWLILTTVGFRKHSSINELSKNTLFSTSSMSSQHTRSLNPQLRDLSPISVPPIQPGTNSGQLCSVLFTNCSQPTRSRSSPFTSLSYFSPEPKLSSWTQSSNGGEVGELSAAILLEPSPAR